MKVFKLGAVKDTVFDGGLFNPLQLCLHLFGVLTEVDTLKTDGRKLKCIICALKEEV